MSVKKFIKNITEEPLTVINRDLNSNEIWEVSSKLWTSLYEDEDVRSNLIANKIEISSDGINALNYVDAIKLIEKFQDEIKLDNFSYKKIEELQILKIPNNQQMVVKGRLTVLGRIENKGNIWVI